MDSLHRTILHLSLIQGVGPGRVNRLINNFDKDQLCQIYHFSVSDLIHRCGFTERQAELLHGGLQDERVLEDEIQLIEKHNVQVLTITDKGYPYLLKQIHLPPTLIYVKGSLGVQEKSLAIIGSRKAHRYAENIINDLMPALIAHEWTIVSGGALGADTMAHRAALQNNGKTVAVLGSGLLIPYPSRNVHLFEKIIESGGAVVSPFPLMMDAIPGNFPARNRIISGLSRGCLVVQAAKRSGASITASFALEQGREVFAVPGSITDELSAGCQGKDK